MYKKLKKLFPTLTTTLLYSCCLSSLQCVQPKIPCTVQLMRSDQRILLREIWNVDLGRMELRLSRGDKCYLGFIDGKVCHYSWVQAEGFHWIKPAKQWINIKEDSFWIYHCRTVDWARGMAVYPFVLNFILDDYITSGYKTGWIYTTRDNIASQKGIERAGFQIVKHLNLISYGSHALIHWGKP